MRRKFGDVENYYERPLAIYRKALGPRHPAVAGSLGRLAALYIAMGRPKDAEGLYDEANGILASAFGENSPVLAGIMNNKALLLFQLGRIDEAEKLFTRAIGLLRSGAGTETPALAIALNNLADLREHVGRQGDADRLREQSKSINTRIFGRTAANRPGCSATIVDTGPLIYAYAARCGGDFSSFVQNILAEATPSCISPTVLFSALGGVQQDVAVLSFDRRQRGTFNKSFA